MAIKGVKELLYDEGRIKDCPRNRVIMGYWWSFKRKDKLSLYKMFLMSWLGCLQDVLGFILGIILLPVFPFIPFINVYLRYRKDVKLCKKEWGLK